MSSYSTQVLLSSIRSLQATAEYSDLTIFCGNDVHRVHKAIICPRSHFFAGACRVGKEALKNEISLPDDEPKLVRLMVDYLYRLDYEFESEPEIVADLDQEPSYTPPAQEDDELCIHARMYALADKYGIHDLKDLARKKFSIKMSEDWDCRGFPLAVQTVYSTTQDSDYGLRNVVVDAISEHKEMIVERLEVAKLLQEISGLAFDLLKSEWNF